MSVYDAERAAVVETDPAVFWDLWLFHDAPHFQDVRNPYVFADFLRSGSTESVACSSMFGTLALRATGPDGGKVTLSAVRSHLKPEAYAQLMTAYEEVREAGKSAPKREPGSERLQKSL